MKNICFFGWCIFWPFVVGMTRQIDVVSPVASKDSVVYRYSLRHLLKYVHNVRNVYVVCQRTPQMVSIVTQANENFISGDQQVILIDETSFPFNFDAIRAFLRQHRPTEGFDGKSFNGTVVVPDVCQGRKEPVAKMIHRCRQPFKNETKPGTGRNKFSNVMMSPNGKTEIKIQSFDRTGWIYQQFLKLWAGEHIAGILDAYLVLDSDTIFYEDYSPIPEDDTTGLQYNYMPGDGRDCLNPPYFMFTDAMKIPKHKISVYGCAGRGDNRRCWHKSFCPIAHQMVYERPVLRTLFEHIEEIVGKSSVTGRKLKWWEGILLMMPTWHTSPFSEYIMYFQWAMHRFPSHIRIYDNEQIGAAPDEIPSNYFMTNGVGLIEACGLKAFSAASLIAKHELSLQYCKDRSGKKKDSCLNFWSGNHSGAPCPVPKYISYHGFRNELPEYISRIYKEYDTGIAPHNNSGYLAPRGLRTSI